MAREGRIKRGADIVLVIISVFLAIVLWLILSLTAFPDTTKTLLDVPIDLSLDGSWAQLEGLSIINIDNESANISFTGKRAEISSYTNSDVVLKLNLDNVRGSGSYNVPLTVESVHGDQLTDIRVAPASVHIDFDRVATKRFSVEDGTLTVDLENLHAAEGCVIDPSEVEISPSSFEISGPQDYIEQVTSCKLGFEGNLTLSSTQNLNVNQMTFYSSGAVVNDDVMTKSTEQFTVSVPIYFTKELKPDVTLMSYAPDVIDVSTVPYRLTAESILVRSEDSSIQELETVNLGYVDIRFVVPGYVQSFQVAENSHYTNISGIDEIKACFDLEGYTTKTITLSSSQIMLLNPPAGYNFYIEQDKLRVTVVGPEELLDTLDASNFVGQIDLLDYNASTGERFLNVSVFAPGHPNVWTTGNVQILGSFNPVVADAAAAGNPEAPQE